jgi:hypothetical protein
MSSFKILLDGLLESKITHLYWGTWGSRSVNIQMLPLMWMCHKHFCLYWIFSHKLKYEFWWIIYLLIASSNSLRGRMQVVVYHGGLKRLIFYFDKITCFKKIVIVLCESMFCNVFEYYTSPIIGITRVTWIPT